MEDIAHCFGGFFLGGGCDMGVGVQGEAGGEVAEHTADCFNVYAFLQSYGRKGVTKVVESDLWDTCPCQYSF